MEIVLAILVVSLVVGSIHLLMRRLLRPFLRDREELAALSEEERARVGRRYALVGLAITGGWVAILLVLTDGRVNPHIALYGLAALVFAASVVYFVLKARG